MNIYTFIITSLIIILIPGAGIIYTISTGITDGRKTSVIAALGCTIGIIPHLILSTLLMSLLMQLNAHVFLILKITGTLYLIYLGFGMLLSKTEIDFGKTINKGKTFTVIMKGIFINLLNPQLTLFFFSFFPQYISSDSQHYLGRCILLGTIFMVMTFLVFIIYGILAGSTKTFFTRSSTRVQYIQRLFGLIFIAFAIKLTFGTS